MRDGCRPQYSIIKKRDNRVICMNESSTINFVSNERDRSTTANSISLSSNIFVYRVGPGSKN